MSEEAEIFREESLEILEEIEETLLNLKDDPDDRELLNQLFRSFHTIKGSGAMFGFENVAKFTHKIENVVDEIRNGVYKFTAELIDPLLDSRDMISRLIDSGDDPNQITEEEETSLFFEMDKATGKVTESTSTKTDQKTSPKNLKILVVEDDFTSRFILQSYLADFGDPHVAVDGYEAISATKGAMAAKAPYDLVCLDIMMPGIDGKKVAEEIRRLESEAGFEGATRVVMTSAINDQKTIDHLTNNNYCNLYLLKPVSIKKLGEFILNNF